MLKIGVSACFFHADPQRAIFKGKTLLYLVQDVSHWLLAQRALPILVPTLALDSPVSFSDLTSELDGLILQGGSDVAPETYGETPLKPEWSGDRKRDIYEITLVENFLKARKPVLGLCRGLQLLNVACQGTLYQDIATQFPTPVKHRDWDIYDQNFHAIELTAGSDLANLYPATKTAKVNSVHHQAIKDLGKNLRVEAVALPDRLIEAVRLEGPGYCVGVQWHPEFQNAEDQSLLSPSPLLNEFMTAVKHRKVSHA
jgi:putative glutamine amidotransferase